MRKGIIYISVNLFDGRRYIGKTLQEFEMRKYKHLNDAKNGSELYFHRALRKFGEDNFIWSVLEYGIEESVIEEREQYYIGKYKTNNPKQGYNMTEGGEKTHNSSKLTNSDIREIKDLLRFTKIPMNEIATYYSVKGENISDINCGETYFSTDFTYPLRKLIHSREITKETTFKIYDCLREGLSSRVIGEMFGVSSTNILNINKGLIHKYLPNDEYPIAKTKKFHHLDRETIHAIAYELENTDLTQQQIGEKFGVSRKIVNNINFGKHYKEFLEGFEFPLRPLGKRKRKK